jgi:Tol biopolymer transport system component
VIVLGAISLTGCGKFSFPFSRGADLSAPLKTGEETVYNARIEGTAPVFAAGAVSSSAETLNLGIKVKTTGIAGADGFAPIEAAILEGKYEVDGKIRSVALAGQKVSFNYSTLRRVSQWRGLALPTGVELLEVGTPKAKAGKGMKWKVESRRILVVHHVEIAFDKFFTYEGKAVLGGEQCHRLSVSIPQTAVNLGNGIAVEFTGSGEVWISSAGRILKATELLEGTMRNEKVSKEAGKFTQSASLSVPDTTAVQAVAPVAQSSASQSPVSQTTAAQSPSAQSPVAQSPVAKQPPAVAKPAVAAPEGKTGRESGLLERLVFVSNATGKREVWSISPDGTAKECLTGFVAEHWSPVLDPEGKLMACVSRRTSGVNLWGYSLVTGDGVPLTEFGEMADIRCGWASGGSRLVFLRSGKLWSVHRDGFNLQTYNLEGLVTDFSANPATNMVAAVVNVLNQDKIYTVDMLNGAVRELFEGDLPSWSPDASRLAYRGGDSMYVANSDGSLNHPVIKAVLVDAPILWPPAGSTASSGKLVCTTLEERVECIMSVAESQGSGSLRITKRGGRAVAFSPSGDRVAYMLNGDLWIARVDGTEQARMTADGATLEPVWWGRQYVR